MFVFHKSSIIFLSETKLRSSEYCSRRFRWKPTGHFTVDPVSRRGGLAILWFHDVNVRVVGFYEYHIEVHILNYDNVPCWRFVGFYGHPVQSRHFILWRLVDMLVNSSPLPILMASD